MDILSVLSFLAAAVSAILSFRTYELVKKGNEITAGSPFSAPPSAPTLSNAQLASDISELAGCLKDLNQRHEDLKNKLVKIRFAVSEKTGYVFNSDDDLIEKPSPDRASQ
jgi:hypothetical protein